MLKYNYIISPSKQIYDNNLTTNTTQAMNTANLYNLRKASLYG